MARLAQLRNNFFIIVLFVLLEGCHNSGNFLSNSVEIPDVWIQQESSNLKSKKGIMYHHEKAFSGYLFTLSISGDTLLKAPYYKGKQHGLSLSWYAKGQKESERWYVNGYKEGVHKIWWENGKPKSEYHFKNDVYEGNVKEWYETGQLFKDFNYKNGREAGLQRAWKSDGRIKVNYEFKDGRKYGLTGVKNCVSVHE